MKVMQYSGIQKQTRIVENAKANGVNVYQYLKLLLEKQPNDRMTDEELEKLAPWNEEVKTFLETWATQEA